MLGEKGAGQQDLSDQELCRYFERKALDLVKTACEETPPSERPAFWNEYVEVDPALRPISGTV